MKIAAIECDLFFIPLPEVMSDSTHGRIEFFSHITVRVHDQDGTVGTGYTYTVGKTGGPAILSLLQQDVVPLLIDENPNEIGRLWEKMWWGLHYVGRGGIAAFAISAVDIALWDLQAQRASEPLWKLLGGSDPHVEAYAGGIDLQWPLDRLLAQTERHLAQGFRAIKMKVGRDELTEDVQRVAAMRTLLGPEVPLMVDANMRWSVEQAIEAAQELARYDVFWLEEPTLPEDYAGHRRILDAAGVPIASGENLRSVPEFRQLVEAGGVSYPEPDVSNIGGITAWLQVARLAADAQLPVTSHGVHDLHVHLMAAVPNASYLEVHGFSLKPYLRHQLTMHEGRAVAPQRPGHGVEFDWELLAEHRAKV